MNGAGSPTHSAACVLSNTRHWQEGRGAHPLRWCQGQANVAWDLQGCTQQMTGSPLNPLDQPTAGNAWKPSNRDAGNLTADRWQAYSDGRAEARNVTK